LYLAPQFIAGSLFSRRRHDDAPILAPHKIRPCRNLVRVHCKLFNSPPFGSLRIATDPLILHFDIGHSDSIPKVRPRQRPAYGGANSIFFFPFFPSPFSILNSKSAPAINSWLSLVLYLSPFFPLWHNRSKSNESSYFIPLTNNMNVLF